jgi:FAD/FMN-containing dehydrogenase
MTVSVTGGTRYGVLAAQLQSQGCALHNTGSLPHISVAGATATGTHGSGDRNGILSTAVSAVDLVTSDGALLTVNRANADLKALAVGLGAFGLITRLVLDIQPTYLVRQDVYRNAPWDTVLEAFDEVMAGAYSVSLIGDFASPVVQELWQKTRVESPREGHDPPESVHRLHLAQASDRGHGLTGRHRGRARAVRAATPLGQAISVHRRGPCPTLPPAAGVRPPDTDLRPHGQVLEPLPREGRHPAKILLERCVARESWPSTPPTPDG